MELNLKNVGLMGRLDDISILSTVQQIAIFLSSKGLNVILESSLAEKFEPQYQAQWQVSRLKMMGEVCDLVIIIGGDGCFLGAARALSQHKTPVIGVNRGKLGFLTDILPQQVESQLTAILAGDYTIESRFLLECQVKRAGSPVGNGSALNDVVLHPARVVQMIEFELYIEGKFVYTQRSDGLIITTPTGSTAYALSGGGPIMHPSLDAIALVPMFPHTLSSRPLVVPANSEIKLIIGASKLTAPQISCDGQRGIQLEVGDVVYVNKKSHKLNVLHPLQHNFYAVCRSKLGWSSRLT